MGMNSRKRMRALSGKQMLLDFGQKNFGTTRCKVCRMVYIAGDGDDIKTHARFHANYLNEEIKVSRWKNQQILQDFFDGSRVIEISLSDYMGSQLYSKLSILMSRDLGNDGPPDTLTGASHEPGLPSYCRIFVYIEGKKKTAVGCCIAEELTLATIAQRGYQLRRLVGGKSSLLSWRVENPRTEQPKSCGVLIETSLDPQIACNDISLPLCGIRRLWVASRHRRKGIATTLIDILLQHLIYLVHLPRSRVAFAEPTSNGAEFATKFVGRDDFIIY